MKLRTLFFRFLAIYLAGFLIMFMCSFLVAVSSFRIIRSDMLSRWNVTKERGIADIADSISDITIMNRMLIGSGNLGQLSFFHDGDDSSRAVLSLLETGDVFAEAGIIIDDFSYAFVLFRNNDGELGDSSIGKERKITCVFEDREKEENMGGYQAFLTKSID